MDDAKQPCSGGNPDCQGDDSRRGETGAPAEDTQRISEICGEDVQHEVSSATSAKEHYHSGVISHTMKTGLLDATLSGGITVEGGADGSSVRTRQGPASAAPLRQV